MLLLVSNTYNSKNQILKETYSYWKNNKWIEGYITDFTYNASDSLELRTQKKNYLKVLENITETITTEGWRTDYERKWFYNPQGIDIGNTKSIPHPVTDVLTVVETKQYQEDANRNMIAYGELITEFDKENNLKPASATRWNISYSDGGATITKNEIREYNNPTLGPFSVAHVYTLKYDGIIQKGAAPVYDKKYSK
jgi:hypothetical protein